LSLPDLNTPKPNTDWSQPHLIAAATFLGETRLIDNSMTYTEKLSFPVIA
jgi:pantothenate synthetase